MLHAAERKVQHVGEGVDVGSPGTIEDAQKNRKAALDYDPVNE
jgi:hypothetical protein